VLGGNSLLLWRTPGFGSKKIIRIVLVPHINETNNLVSGLVLKKKTSKF
jgi:uncharacterized membrane protein SirB2